MDDPHYRAFKCPTCDYGLDVNDYLYLRHDPKCPRCNNIKVSNFIYFNMTTRQQECIVCKKPIKTQYHGRNFCTFCAIKRIKEELSHESSCTQ